MKNRIQQKIEQGSWRLSGTVIPAEKTKIHEENSYCQFVDLASSHIKPALVFGSTKEEAKTNAERVVKAMNMLIEVEKQVRHLEFQNLSDVGKHTLEFLKDLLDQNQIK